MKRTVSLLLCGLLLLSGCSFSQPDGEAATSAPDTPEVTSAEVTTLQTEATTQSEAPAIEAPHFPEAEPTHFEYAPADAELLIEAEDGLLGGTAQITDSREGYSGSGCVNGIFGGGGLLLEAEIPASQHYHITLRAASDVPVSGRIVVNGAPRGEFELSGVGSFESVRFDNIYLAKGTAQISFADLTADADIDCVMLNNSEDVLGLDYGLNGALSNKYADESAQKLYSYLLSCYGSKVLSGQQCSQGSNGEFDRVYALTGRYPAIRFGELMDYTVGSDTGDIELALEWAESGGIVGYVWNWPMVGSVYRSKTSFDLEKAVTNLDIAAMGSGALELRYTSGDITAETLAVIDGIDKVSQQLLRLKDAGAAVIFRPLPEASSGLFWWSESVESYLWLYKLIYERMTLYWDLGNLIWVWNGQSADWYVGDGYADIISLDVYYPEDETPPQPSGVNFILAASKISAAKPIAMSECSDLPSPDGIEADRAYWLYCSAWTGDYSAGGKYMQDGEWVQFYNSTAVIAKDEIDYVR